MNAVVQIVVVGCVAATVLGVAAAAGAPSRAHATPPAGTPDLSQMALRLSDLPAGAKVKKQGYVTSADVVAEYDRVFKDDSARIGKTRLLALESDVALLELVSQ